MFENPFLLDKTKFDWLAAIAKGKGLKVIVIDNQNKKNSFC